MFLFFLLLDSLRVTPVLVKNLLINGLFTQTRHSRRTCQLQRAAAFHVSAAVEINTGAPMKSQWSFPAGWAPPADKDDWQTFAGTLG
ncbi:MAG: hypothetical protein NTX35_18615 [Verrucomicrobia bacterium]|nr:hypothetical protein [Verrucomicrobiota bacterium]